MERRCGRPSSAAARSAASTPRRCARCPRRTSSPPATPTRAAPRPSPRSYGVPAVHRRRRRCSARRGVEAVIDRHAAPAARRAGDPRGGGRRSRPRREADGRDPRRLRRHARRGARGRGHARASSASGGSTSRSGGCKAAIDAGQDRPPGARRLPDVQLARSRPTTGPTPGAAGGTPKAAACSSTSRRTSSTCCSGSWAPVEEVSGYWANLNHPDVEVEDTAVATIRFRNGGLGSIVDERVAEAGPLHQGPRPRLERRLGRRGDRPRRDVHRRRLGDRRAAAQRPVDDPRRGRPARRRSRPRTGAGSRQIDATTHYHALQIRDFLAAILEDRPPLVTGEDGREVVAMFTAIYRSRRERRPIPFPLQAE